MKPQPITPERLHLRWYLFYAAHRAECIEVHGLEATRAWEASPDAGMKLLYFRTAQPKLAAVLPVKGMG